MAIDEIRKEELKRFLVPYVRSITQPDPKAGRNKYKCPLCGSGRGSNGTGAFTIYPETNTWCCFACPSDSAESQVGGDIFTLVELHEGIKTFPEQVEFIERFAGLPSIQDYPIKKYNDKVYTVNSSISDEDRQKYARERKDYIERCASRAGGTDYFAKRGFTETEVRRFSLGYDPRKNGRPGVVIPYNDEDAYYVVRYTDNEGQRYWAPPESQAGGRRVYNKAALYGSKPCFVCEGELNAISILAAAPEACGAVSLGGAGMTKYLIEAVKEKKPTCPLILNLDPDEAGENARERITGSLDEMKIPYIFANFEIEKYPEGKRKDANDFLIADRIQLKKDIYANVEAAANMVGPAPEEAAEEDNERKDKLIKHEQRKAAVWLDKLDEQILKSADRPYIPTGYKGIDKILDGGLYAGLYIIGAVTGVGKTSFVLQMADNIAACGTDVLLFSLEMAATELVARSICRLTYEIDKRRAKNIRQVTVADFQKKFSKEDVALIEKARSEYKKAADNLYIYEGLGNIGAEQIINDVREHIELTGRRPVVIVDYLQILAPYDVRYSDKQNIDKDVLELKRLSRDSVIPVVAISSFNRDSYKGGESKTDLTSFKESGAIEYGSDVLLAMVKGTRTADEGQPVNLKVMKNRNGEKDRTERFIFQEAYYAFVEAERRSPKY